MTVEVGALCFVRDHIVAHHAHSYVTEAPHQLELLFLCSLSRDAEPAVGPVPDAQQLGVAWLGVDGMLGVTLKPSWLREVLIDQLAGRTSAVYQGDRD